MSVIDDIRATLNAIGFAQQACLFVFLATYPLTLGTLASARGRRTAGLAAALSMAGFVCLTDPWMYGVLIAAAMLAGVGAFIATAWLLDQLPRLVVRPQPRTRWAAPGAPLQALDTTRERDGLRRPKLPLKGQAGTT
jgi:hypothetical protein